MNYLYYKAVNWDELQDALDQYTWEKLTNNFWLDTRIPLKEDIAEWENLSVQERDQLNKLFASLSVNYTLQSEYGAASLRRGIQTQQEEAVLNITTFMESVHTKAITTFFRAFIDEEETAAYYAFADQQSALARELQRISESYQTGNELQKKAAFLLCETILTYGRLAPVFVKDSLIQTNQLVGNLLRGSSIYSAYLGYKFQLACQQLSAEERTALIAWVNQLVEEMLSIEVDFIQEIGEPIIGVELLHYATNYFYHLLGFPQSVSYDLPADTLNKITNLITSIDDLQKQSRLILSSKTEDMENGDYEF
ncbi:ribonucleotide-diphosphate reductase subunit beta [Enterococcus gallinarum]|uniref:ribonucleotide-diphosphate reductase subunit beta n=1 Tax=Enterococcus gallinarum TaxID=1353 RepID=UPI001D173B4F|nr:ribonucleotide-diphosphate reductase subunit beta [Enterococcus gallinarum]MCC4043701.1 ribonucleotide-diphosphate reductase subunit beta [Enterococcus gallinarum]